MPKQSLKAEINSFVQGLITEASPLNFPANASLDEQNFELFRNGTRSRRNGMGFEENYSTILTPATGINTMPNSFIWKNVNGNSALNLAVVQIDTTLYFFDINQASLSGTGYVGSLNLFSSEDSFTPNGVCFSFTNLDGFLSVAACQESVAIVSYEGGAFSATFGRLQVRDLWGVAVGTVPPDLVGPIKPGSYFNEVEDGYHFTSLNTEHYYNLQNQSWGIPRKNKDNVLVDPQVQYFTDIGRYPTNYEKVWTGLQFQPVESGADPYERMFSNLYIDALGSELNTSKGYFIIDLLRRGTGRQNAYSENNNKYPELVAHSIPFNADITPSGAKTVAAWAGRVFYSGFSGEVIDGDTRSPNLSNYVVFSVLVDNKKDFFKCYQAGDPTSRDSNEIVDTDGGFIKIAEAETIVSMFAIKDALLVMASNGVWAIRGGNDFGFSAANYRVDKISSFSVISQNSIVEEGGRVFFWGSDGIYVIAKNQYGDLEVSSISEKTIQTFYQNIPALAKETATGVYDSISKTIRWIYKIGTPFTSDSETKELVLNTFLGAFYVNKIYNKADNSVEVFSLFSSLDLQTTTFDVDVISDGELVVSDGDDVFVPNTGRINPSQSTRYLAVIKQGTLFSFSFSYYNNSSFRDWDETDAFGFVLAGDNIASDSSSVKQVPYLTMHFYRTEDGIDVDGVPLNQSSCKVRTQWNWARNANSKKFGSLFQAYRYRQALFSEVDYDNGEEIIVTKNKIRGRGRAFALYFETEPGKDCRVVGWSLSVNGNAIT